MENVESRVAVESRSLFGFFSGAEIQLKCRIDKRMTLQGW